MLARYGRQQIWPEGVMNAPLDEVLAIEQEIFDLIAIENSAPRDPTQREDS